MKTVKFLHTSAGTYGIAHTGDELTLKDSLANQLEKAGVVEITGDAEEDAEESKAQSGSFRIHDETSKEKVVKLNAEEEKEDPHDPTNEAKNKAKEKNEKAGPNVPKRK